MSVLVMPRVMDVIGVKILAKTTLDKYRRYFTIRYMHILVLNKVGINILEKIFG